VAKSSDQKASLNKGSLYQWALASFLIVTLPLIFAIFYTVYEVGDFTEKSQSALFKTVHETESTRIILERLNSMERNIRQFQLFGTIGFFDLFLENRDKFLKQVATFDQQKIDDNLIRRLDSLSKNEHSLYVSIFKKLEDKKDIKLTQEDLNVYDELTQQVKKILTEGEKRVATESKKLSISAEKFKIELISFAIISIALALLLSLIFVLLLLRPIKDITIAIRTIGDKGFSHAISIRGPRDLQQLGEQLEWLRIKLGSLEKEKQQFIRNVSHELKTPLATLKEGTDLLSDNIVGELNTEQQEIIQLMKISNITINDLVENLLEYQRSISSKITFNCSTFKLEALVNRITDEYELLLRSKNISLDSKLNPTQINADYEKLKIVISNVFSNALKFAPPNSSIRLTLSEHDKIITLTIEDQGPGISKEVEQLIFKDFYRGNSSSSDWKIKDSGLGLALVRHYLDIHHGSVKLLSKCKKYSGARFSIYLPQKQNIA